MDNLLQLITSDGLNITFKYSQMNNINYGLFPGYKDFPEVYKIKYKLPNHQGIKTLRIQARQKSEILEIKNKTNQRNLSALKFSTIDSLSTAIMTVKEFIYFPIKEFQDFIKNSFVSLSNKSIRNLLLDLRGNDGGDPANAAEILSYITDLKPIYFEEWVPGYPKLKKPLQVNKPQFRGNLYVLIDGESFSTTGHLLSLIKYHNLGLLVGEESGGSFYCYGCQTDIKLPQTKIVFSYSTCTYQTKVAGFSSNTGIRPDIKIQPTVEDIITGKDAVMEYILNLLSE